MTGGDTYHYTIEDEIWFVDEIRLVIDLFDYENDCFRYLYLWKDKSSSTTLVGKFIWEVFTDVHNSLLCRILVLLINRYICRNKLVYICSVKVSVNTYLFGSICFRLYIGTQTFI